MEQHEAVTQRMEDMRRAMKKGQGGRLCPFLPELNFSIIDFNCKWSNNHNKEDADQEGHGCA